jgi:3-hydroxyisobutyrate dehydrogenase-like beta-hydroxyacid dehydrogenase
MGAGLGRALRAGGARVVATVDGRSARTRRLAEEAGLELLPSLTDVVAAADVVLVVTPPGDAVAAAAAIRAAAEAAGARPIVADLNAVSPTTMARIEATLGDLTVVDGSISGPPPTDDSISGPPPGENSASAERPTHASNPGPPGENSASAEPPTHASNPGPPGGRPGPRLYLSGARAGDVAGLPWGGRVEAIVLGERVGAASALKMCTGSVYKGLTALITQAMRTAGAYGVLDGVVLDLERNGLAQTAGVARSATKAWRFVDEMREVAATQEAAGLAPELFTAIAGIYAQVAGTALAQGDPESARELSAAEIVAMLER